MKKIMCWVLLFLMSFVLHATSTQPKLIVQIVIDQLRGDLIQRHQQQFTANGFNYLLNHGINYQNAQHPHANTVTCVGHATISTGSYPSLHGIVDNDWYDRDKHRFVYCMEDLQAKILATVHTKIITPGRSPKPLKASTLSDEIILANKGRVFGVSLKDRAAITLAGHAGKAFWFDLNNGGFVSSEYYYKQYPQWVSNWNQQYQARAYDWNLSQPRTTYQNVNNKPFNHDYHTFGQTFPHHVTNPPSQSFFKSFSRTPLADQLTAQFAEQILINEHLGLQDNQTDYLAISFSVVDAIGHQFGPNSLEAEDNLLVLDKTIAQLLSTIDKQVGLKNTLIIVTADHGMSDSPSYLKAHHIAAIKPVNIASLSDLIRKTLKERFTLPQEVLLAVLPPFVYLDHPVIDQHKLQLATVTQYLADTLTQQPGIFKAYALPAPFAMRDWLGAKVDKMAYPSRAGDVYLVRPPFQSRGDSAEDQVIHGSPWQYDSHVPLLFVHPSFQAQSIVRPVFSTDIASTLSALLLIKAPSAAVGQPLTEVLRAVKQIKYEKTS